MKYLIVAFSSVADARVSRLIPRCQELGVDVSVVPRMFDLINDRVGYDTVGGLPLLSFTAVDPKGMQFTIKHALDRVFALLLLIMLSPLLLLAALAVRLELAGTGVLPPAPCRPRRPGVRLLQVPLDARRLARPTLVEEDDERAGLPARRRHRARRGRGRGPAHRGRALPAQQLARRAAAAVQRAARRHEPRRAAPRAPRVRRTVPQDIIRYGDRHRVKSGITGWAQVHGLRGQTSLAERVEWDNYYIAHWSLGLDLKILALTLVALFRNAE